LGLSDRALLQDSFNLSSLSGLVRFTKKVILGTFVIEFVGALMYMTVFVPQFGAKGIWISVFNSISAFCNAGIDIISENSLCEYALNPVINITTSLLIILGGLGFVVWWDIVKAIKNFKRLKLGVLKNLTLHSKIVLCATVLLLGLGTVAILIFEYDNPLTIGGFTLPQKIQAAFFQSVTTRTAGFATIPQQNFTNASAFVSILLMFIGGSPIGTAGGIKTVTLIVLIASIISTIKNKNETVLFNRRISKKVVDKAIAVTGMSLFILITSTVLLAAVTDADSLAIVYETASATATVGLTRSLTPLLNGVGKIIIIATMYLGRVGPISLAVAFKTRKETANIVKNPTEEISVG
jgi:trk system potassium uptake protein TrkH